MAAIAGAAGATNDLPEALPKWRAWLAPLRETLTSWSVGSVLYWGILIAIVLVVILIYFQERRERKTEPTVRAPLQPTTPSAAPERAVAATTAAPMPSEKRASVSIDTERIREIWPSCTQALQRCQECLSAIVETVQYESPTSCENLLTALLVEHVVNPGIEQYNRLRQLVPSEGPLDVAAFDLLCSEFEVAKRHYAHAISLIRESGRILLGGSRLLALKEYQQLYEAHGKLVGALQWIGARSDIGRLASRLKDFEHSLQPPDLQRKEHLYVTAEIIYGRPPREFVGRGWGGVLRIVEVLPNEPMPILKCMALGSDTAAVFQVKPNPAPDIVYLLRPGRNIQLDGTIRTVVDRTIYLDPADIVSVDSDPT
jgi:hypothetical protein